jgi:hypothetical protein
MTIIAIVVSIVRDIMEYENEGVGETLIFTMLIDSIILSFIL